MGMALHPPFKISSKIDEHDIEDYCKEICKNVARFCSLNNQFHAKYVVNDDACVNVTNTDGELMCPALDHSVPDIGCSYIILERFYKGADEHEIDAKASTFANTYSEVAGNYFTPLNVVHSVKAQQFGYLNADKIESEVEEECNEIGGEGDDVDGPSVMANGEGGGATSGYADQV